MVKKVKEALEGVDGVSTTVDEWTANHRSYLGMTVHWIDTDTLKRCKAAIACLRITGHHTYDVIFKNRAYSCKLWVKWKGGW